MLHQDTGDLPPFFLIDVEDKAGQVLHFFQIQASQGLIKD